MPNETRKRLKRCLGKTVNYLDLTIPALAEVWAACVERDKLIAARVHQGHIPEIDDNREPEPSYTENLAACLQTLDKVNEAVQAISMQMMNMDHEQLLAAAR